MAPAIFFKFFYLFVELLTILIITRPNSTPDDGIDAWISPEIAGNLL